jgi:hypothetical protein
VSLDAQALGEFAARTLEQLEADDDVPPDAHLVDAALIVEVTGTDDDGDPISIVHGFTMSERNVAAIGLLIRGLRAAVAPD